MVAGVVEIVAGAVVVTGAAVVIRLRFQVVRNFIAIARSRIETLVRRARRKWRRRPPMLRLSGPPPRVLGFRKSYEALRREAEQVVADAIREQAAIDSHIDSGAVTWRVLPLLADVVTCIGVDGHSVALRRAEAITLAETSTIRSIDNAFNQYLAVRRSRLDSLRLQGRIAVIEMLSEATELSSADLEVEVARERAADKNFVAGGTEIELLLEEVPRHVAESVQMATRISAALHDLSADWERVQLRILDGARALDVAKQLVGLYRSHLGLELEHEPSPRRGSEMTGFTT